MFVHNLAPPRAFTPEVNHHKPALLGNVEEVTLLNEGVLSVTLCEHLTLILSLFLHLFKAFSPELIKVVLVHVIELPNLLVNISLSVGSSLCQSANQALLHHCHLRSLIHCSR